MTITTATPNPFAGVEMKQANRARKHLPGGGELATMIRAGITVPELVARFDSSKTSIYTRLRDSGYTSDGTTPPPRAARIAPPFELMPEEWTEGAECAKSQYDPDLWHADGRGSRYATTVAKAVCKSACPVRAQCLEFGLRMDALNEGRSYGVCGGLTADERAELAKKRAK